MLRIVAVTVLATVMSVGLAEAKGKPKASLAPCQTGKGNMRLRTSKNRLPGGNVLSRFLEFLHAITH